MDIDNVKHVARLLKDGNTLTDQELKDAIKVLEILTAFHLAYGDNLVHSALQLKLNQLIQNKMWRSK